MARLENRIAALEDQSGQSTAALHVILYDEVGDPDGVRAIAAAGSPSPKDLVVLIATDQSDQGASHAL